MKFEAILSFAASAFERKTGREFEYSSELTHETFANVAGWTSQARPD